MSANNRGVVYLEPGRVEVRTFDFPKMQNPKARIVNATTITLDEASEGSTIKYASRPRATTWSA